MAQTSICGTNLAVLTSAATTTASGSADVIKTELGTGPESYHTTANTTVSM